MREDIELVIAGEHGVEGGEIAQRLLQALPAGIVPLEMTDQPETVELARTVAVRRGDGFRFHIALQAGLALMALSPEPEQQALTCGSFAHEAAHVEHEEHLHRTFPEIYSRTLECGDRSNRSFSKPSMSGANMLHVDPRQCVDQKRERISTASFVGRLSRAVYRQKDGLPTIATAGGQPRVFERFSKPSEIPSSLPVICSDIFEKCRDRRPDLKVPQRQPSRPQLRSILGHRLRTSKQLNM